MHLRHNAEENMTNRNTFMHQTESRAAHGTEYDCMVQRDPHQNLTSDRRFGAKFTAETKIDGRLGSNIQSVGAWSNIPVRCSYGLHHAYWQQGSR